MMASKASLESVGYGARGWPRRPALLVQTSKKFCFVPTERDRDFCRLLSTHQPPNVFSRRLTHPRHVSPTEV